LIHLASSAIFGITEKIQNGYLENFYMITVTIDRIEASVNKKR